MVFLITNGPANVSRAFTTASIEPINSSLNNTWENSICRALCSYIVLVCTGCLLRAFMNSSKLAYGKSCLFTLNMSLSEWLDGYFRGAFSLNGRGARRYGD